MRVNITSKGRGVRLDSSIIKLPPLRWWGQVVGMVALLMIAGWLFAMRFSIGINPQILGCIPGRVLLVDHWDRMPRRGRIYAYRTKQAEPVYPNGTLMAKFLVAGPGDTVAVTDDFRILVNDQVVARGLPHLKDLSSEALKSFIGSRVLMADQYWMLGTLPMSFDSRYWGAIHGDQIVGRAYVLF